MKGTSGQRVQNLRKSVIVMFHSEMRVQENPNQNGLQIIDSQIKQKLFYVIFFQ